MFWLPRNRHHALVLTIFSLALTQISVARSFAAEDSFYKTEVKPILESKCYPCHGALKQEAGLRLETVDVMREGGDSGAVIVPGNADDSLLVQRIIESEHSRMPPAEDGAALQASDIEIIKRWIKEGANSPDEELPPSPTAHWSFQSVVKPALPQADDAGQANVNPIDRLLAAHHVAHGLTPQPAALRETRLRRLYLDLIGLPPTREQLNDSRPWEEIVDELLATAPHAERWARHWMDIWRYSDWYGLNEQLRNSTKHIWRWRDWIVNSLHDNKPYDRMVHEMLAGDELAPEDPNVVVATGFLARNYYLFNRTTWLDDTIEHTSKAFMGLTLNCSKCHDHKYDPLSHIDYYRFRAIFEPHQVRLDPVPGSTDFSTDGLPRVFDDHLETPTHLHLKGDPKQPDESLRIDAGVPSLFASFAPSIEPVELPIVAWAPGVQPFVQADRIRAAEIQVNKAREELAALGPIAELPPTLRKSATEKMQEGKIQDANQDAEATKTQADTARKLASMKLVAMEASLAAIKATCAADNARYLKSVGSSDERETNELARAALRSQVEAERANAAWEREEIADKDKKKQNAADERLKQAEARLTSLKDSNTAYVSLRASQKLLETPEHKEPDYASVYPSTSTGRRLALARWMTTAEHPLTARVAINHIWLRHMGEPLVENVFDFGLRSPRPPLADVLDYLAAEFMESDWDQRHIHRLIVTSAAYQRDSSTRSADANKDTIATDSINQYYWRANPRRMESQVVRDSLLFLAGSLDMTLGGPSLNPDQPNTRRGIYLKHSRDHQEKLHGAFDDADYLQCYRRAESIIPQQALALANSRLAIDSSKQIADRLLAESAVAEPSLTEPKLNQSNDRPSDWNAFVDIAYQTVLGRRPNGEELVACLEFCEEQEALTESDEPALRRSRTASRLVHVLLNHNDFLTVR